MAFMDGEKGKAGGGDTAWLLAALPQLNTRQPALLLLLPTVSSLVVECGKEIRAGGDFIFVYLFSSFQVSFSMRIA
ncbi:MAG: hypothetical protein ACLTAF_03695 [Blautia coccoides]